MRFIMLVKASQDSEAGTMPSEQELTEMGRYNEELVDAGVLLSGEGLHESAKGARVSFSGGTTTVTDGPFDHPEQLVAGYWVLQVASRAEAIDWARRVPFTEGEVEVRQIFEAEDFADVSPEIVEKEAELRARIDQ